MNYLAEILAFERWIEADHLPALSQLLWYRLMALNNWCGWAEWFAVDNRRLMTMTGTSNEKSLIAARNKLIEKGMIDFKKGKKGSPSKYRMRSIYCQIVSTYDSTMDSTNAVHLTGNATAINKQNKIKEKQNNSCSSYGDARADVLPELEDYDGMTEADRQCVVSFAGYLLPHYFGREPTPADVEKVCEQIHTPEGIDRRCAAQLERAFDIAADADERTWRYVYGILENRQEERDRRETG